MQIINLDAALQAHPEFLNENIDDHDKAIYAKGWNDCNKEYYSAITELSVASTACTDLSTRLRRAFEADELVNQRILLEAADTIVEMLGEVERAENRHVVESEMIDEMYAEIERLKAKVPRTKKKTLEKAHKEFMKNVNEANAVSYARRVKQQSEEARKLREEIEKLDGCKAPEPPKEVHDV